MLRIRAGSVYPVTAPPIEDGAVLVDDRGKIVAVGRSSEVPNPPDARIREFPGGLLVPGLVNCHTHLELTHLAGRTSEREFARWIRTIRALKDATTPDEFRRSAEQGVRDSWAAGVTCVADTGSTGAVMHALHALGGRGICYHEVFGPDPAQARTSLADLEQSLTRLGPLASSQVRLGVSPHAPYTVSEPLYRAVDDLARSMGLPLATHLAESREETELVRDGSGAFADALRARGIAVHPQDRSPVQYLLRLGVLERATGWGWLCIHCVHVDEPDIAALRRRRTRGSRLDSAPMKTQRHAAILKIVRAQTVASQERLRELLEAEGFEVTQATLSRDIRELGLAKVAAPDGGSHYAPPPEGGPGGAIRPHLEQLRATRLTALDGVGPLLGVR